MMFKRMCPVCGAWNTKERETCLECGSQFNAKPNEELPRIGSADAESSEVTETKRRAEEKYFGSEKIVFKTDGQAGFKSDNLKEAEILVDEENLIIKWEEMLKIPLSRIEDINFNLQSQIYVRRSNEGQTITFLDHQNKKYRLFLLINNNKQYDLQKALYRQMVGKYIKTAPPHAGRNSPGNFFFRVRESFRDKTRDDFFTFLKTMEIDAQLASRGRFEEEISDLDLEYGGNSLGIIGIEKGPVNWINIRKSGGMESRDTLVYFFDYGIRDAKLTTDSPFRTYHFVNSHWEGTDHDSGVLEGLNNDHSLKQPFLEGIRIAAVADYGCWIISKKQVTTDVFPLLHLVEFLVELFSARREQKNANFVPSTAEWKCYETIAQYLLADHSD
jgi:hypothetical protein